SPCAAPPRKRSSERSGRRRLAAAPPPLGRAPPLTCQDLPCPPRPSPRTAPTVPSPRRRRRHRRPPGARPPPPSRAAGGPPRGRRRRRRERLPFGRDGTVRTTVHAPTTPDTEAILTPQALALLTELHRRFAGRRAELLELRQRRRRELAEGGTLDFLPETRHIREDPTWQVAPPAPGLEDRRVEITGPTERKMTINALNSGAQVWLADLEDANTPHFDNVIAGQVNLRDAIRRTITFTSPEGKEYRLRDGDLPTIV